MDRIRLNLVRQSYAWFSPCGPAMMAAVVRRLSESAPGTRELFPDDASVVNGVLFKTLGQVVSNADRFHRIEAPLAELGRKAHEHGARAADFQAFREELIGAMRALAGDDWSEGLEGAWRELLHAVAGAMLAGALGRKAA